MIGSITNSYTNGYINGYENSAQRTSGMPGNEDDTQKAYGMQGIGMKEDDPKTIGIKEDDSKTNGAEECQTCKNRKYQDGSDEANVSFKNAAHISPEAAASAVRAHESQHVKNAYNKAAERNGEVISASVSIHMAVCPECGRTYVSGGTTQTAIRYINESNPYQQRQKSLDGISLRGRNLDYKIA